MQYCPSEAAAGEGNLIGLGQSLRWGVGTVAGIGNRGVPFPGGTDLAGSTSVLSSSSGVSSTAASFHTPALPEYSGTVASSPLKDSFDTAEWLE